MVGSGKKVFVGMSGGVDSSVSAALLKEQGYEVIGVFIKVWQADFLPCTWREERREAMRAAAHLNIPLITLDLEKEYKEGVVDYMIREYGAGRVPNPDVMCNKHVKFGAFYDFARAHGANFIATGHYAQRSQPHLVAGPLSEVSGPVTKLMMSADVEKDQTYFLWTLTPEILTHTLFPVGHLKKSEVRALAEKFGLPNAAKKDSQGLCFMGAVDMADFLKHYLKTTPGAVLSESGEVIGTHDGAMLYTIGQRRGFTTTKRSTNETPYFVVAKDLAVNTITVAHHDPSQLTHSRKTISLEQINLADYVKDCDRSTLHNHILARIRHRGELLPATFTVDAADACRGTLTFQTPLTDLTSGQSVVFYKDGICLGGGIIAE